MLSFIADLSRLPLDCSTLNSASSKASYRLVNSKVFAREPIALAGITEVLG